MLGISTLPRDIDVCLWDKCGVMLLKIEGLKNTWQAASLLETGEHIWVRGIGDVLIFVRRLSESNFRMCLYSVDRIAKRFTINGVIVNGKVKAGEVVKLIEKLSARPCHVVGSNLIDAAKLKEIEGLEMGYTEFVKIVQNSGIRVQASPFA